MHLDGGHHHRRLYRPDRSPRGGPLHRREGGGHARRALLPGFPADGVLQKGDRIISVDGQRGDQEKISKLISSHKCAEQPPTNGCVAQTAAVLKVERHGKVVTVSIRPKYEAAEKRMLVG